MIDTKNLFLGMIILSCMTSFAQKQSNYSLKFSETLTFEGNYLSSVRLESGIVGRDQDALYFFQEDIKQDYLPFRINPKPVTANLIKFDHDFNTLVQAKIKLGQGKQREIPIMTMMPRGKLHLLSERTNRKEKEIEVIHRLVDTENLNYSDTGRVIGAVKYDPKNDYFFWFTFLHSTDSSKVLFIHYIPEKFGVPGAYGFSVFDDNMNLLWKGEMSTIIRKRYMQIEKFVLNNEGKIFAHAKVYPKKKMRPFDEYKHAMVVINPNGDEPDEYPLTIEGYPLANVTIQPEPNGDMSFMGLILKGKMLNFQAEGTFYIRIDGENLREKEKLVFNYNEPEMKTLLNVKVKGAYKKEKRLIGEELVNAVAFHRVVHAPSGSKYLIGEVTHFYKLSTAVVNSQWVLLRGNIFVLKINREGEIERLTQIKKMQESSLFYDISYGFAMTKDNLFFIFNDHINNKDLNPEEVEVLPSHFRDLKEDYQVVMVSMNEQGELKKEVLLAPETFTLGPLPYFTKQYIQNEFIIPLVGGTAQQQQKQLVRVSLGE